MNFIDRLLAYARLLPALFAMIQGFVQQIESLFPEGGNGATKLAKLRELLAGVWGQFEDVFGKFEAAWPLLNALIASAVTLFNAAGVFKKSGGKQ